METLLPWQQANCAITLLCESILSSYFANMFLGTKHITGVPGCYGSTVTLSTKDCSIAQQYGSILSSYLMFIGTKCITGLPFCYGNTVPDVFLRIIPISILPSYCGNTVTNQNQMLTSSGNSISSSRISCKRSLSQMNTAPNNPLLNFW